MKQIIHPIIFSIFLLSVCAFTTPVKWYLFECKPYGFKVEFPSKPTEKTKIIESGDEDLSLSLYECVGAKKDSTHLADPNLIYIASCIEYPKEINAGDKEKQKALCRKAIDGAVKKVKGTLIKETPITLNGYQGTEARIEYKDGKEILRMRLYLVQNKMYMLETVTDIAKDNNKSIHRFMDSFKLLK